MTVDEVIETVARIDANALDDEGAHSMEDALYLTVLTAIANGAENPSDLAREAIKADQIEFARWCA